MHRVAVIGGGITGLTAAFRLSQRGVRPVVFEATERVGGPLRTSRVGGYLAEHGPNSILERPPVARLIADLGLTAERIQTSAAAVHRYVVRDGRMVALPTSPAALLRSPLFSLGAKLRLLREPFIPAAVGEESLASFVRRRLGAEVLEYAVNPFVAGIYAGDPATLSVEHAFGALHRLESNHGSLMRGQRGEAKARRQRGEAKPARPSSISFRDGIGTLPDRLSDRLGDAVRVNAPAVRLRREADGGWLVTSRSEDDFRTERFSAVIYTAPIHRLPGIDIPDSGDLGLFSTVPHPPVSVLTLGFACDDIAHPLDGFGVLVPAVERRQILGALFSSTLFPGRAPAAHALLTVFIGGTRQPELAALPLDRLLEMALADLRPLIGLTGAPKFVHHTHWPLAIPQYTLGYGRIKARMDQLEQTLPGLHLAGSFRTGISVADSLTAGDAVAVKVAEALRLVAVPLGVGA